ncbi:MAG TPA: outer membrane lipoprotein carrier protein LolA, partial [Steroidobacteraceae bacterium]|nr:outer membrane lipoprotein carrier protein LolA [Steroidobacteraceae bacterium]
MGGATAIGLLVGWVTAAAALAAPAATTAPAVPAPAAVLAPAAVPAAPAAEQNARLLNDYLDNLKTLRTTFLQTLADAQGREIDRATGTLIVARPGKFRW